MTRKMKRRWQREMKRAMARKVLPMAMTAGIILGSCGYVLAQPGDGEITAGSGRIDTNGSTTTITQTTDKLAIDWQSFNIGNGESVIFIQPGTSSIALNRVVGNDVSAIYGTLSANGKVFLINPNGILFGSNAQVDVGGLVASALSISNEDFLAGNYTFQNNGFAGAIANDGQIIATDGGYVVLLGSQVDNRGIIVARQGTVALGAGDRISLDFYGDGLLNLAVDQAAVNASVANHQLIQADGGRVLMTARTADALAGTVVNNTGMIMAQGVEEQNGVIILHGGSQGTVANSGELTANGGHVETSGGELWLGGSVTADTWLIDPTDLIVDATQASTVSASLNNGTSVTLQTQVLGSGYGDIYVENPISWTSNSTLTLTAHRNININADITATGRTAGLVITPGVSGIYRLGPGGRITLTGSAPNLTIAGNRYIIINSLSALQSVGLTGFYALGSDIDASSTAVSGFTPIGPDGYHRFTGIFDGCGHIIDGLHITGGSDTNTGLFGAISAGSILRNVGVTNCFITASGNSKAGALVGYASAADYGEVHPRIINCFSTGSVTGGYGGGGLVGMMYNTDILDCYSTATVNGQSAGGLVGDMRNSSSIRNSYSTGTVRGVYYIGGLVGSATGSIVDCYSTGSVTGSYGQRTGGLVGYNASSISNCFSTGNVSGSTGRFIGGFAGDTRDGTITNCYWNITTSGQSKGLGDGSSSGLAGLTSAQMMNQDSFVNWDLNSTWRIYDGFTYPLLKKFMKPVTITANNAVQTYNGKLYDGSAGLTCTTSDGSPVDFSLIFGTHQFSGNGTDAGTYTITPFGLYSNQQGYDITFAGGSLTINPATLTISANNAVKTYNGLEYTGGNAVSYSGFITGEDTSVLSGVLSYGGDSQGAVNAGTYIITPGGLSSNNYIISYVNGSLTVNKAPLTIKANNDVKTYNDLAYVRGNGVTYHGLVPGEEASVLTGTLSYSGNSQGAINAGTYTITPGGLSSANYNITFVNGALTINPAELRVVANTNTKTYDGTTSAATLPTVIGLQGSDDLIGLREVYANCNAGENIILTPEFTINDGNGGNNYIVTVETAIGSINPATLTITARGQNKVYDGTTVATVTFNDNRIAGDDLTIDYTAAFLDKNVGHNKTVDVIGITLGGADAGNYTFNTTDITSADITPATLTITASGHNKVYDGTTTATVTLGDDRIAGDDLTINYTVAFQDKNVGNNKTVNVSGITLNGADAENYTFNNTTITSSDITPATLIVTAKAYDKVYDGTTAATVSFGDNSITGDELIIDYSTVAFIDKNVGNNKTVNVSGITLSGTDAGNYIFNTTTSANADIIPATLTITASGHDKVYDGTTTATVTFSDDRIARDDLTIDYTADFLDKNVGDNKTVNVTGITLGGADAGNYIFNNTAMTIADITPATLTITASGHHKVYDGTTTATVTLSDDRIAGDDLTIDYTAAFLDKNVGDNKTVSVSGITLGGTDAGNYVFNNSVVTSGDITPAALIITADDAIRFFGFPDPTFTVTCNGFVANESLESLDGSLILTTSATRISTVGQYDIIPFGVSSDNYEITFIRGVLTILTPDPMKNAMGSASQSNLWFEILEQNNDELPDPLIAIVGNGVNAGGSGTESVNGNEII